MVGIWIVGRIVAKPRKGNIFLITEAHVPRANDVYMVSVDQLKIVGNDLEEIIGTINVDHERNLDGTSLAMNDAKPAN